LNEMVRLMDYRVVLVPSDKSLDNDCIEVE